MSFYWTIWTHNAEAISLLLLSQSQLHTESCRSSVGDDIRKTAKETTTTLSYGIIYLLSVPPLNWVICSDHLQKNILRCNCCCCYCPPLMICERRNVRYDYNNPCSHRRRHHHHRDAKVETKKRQSAQWNCGDEEKIMVKKGKWRGPFWGSFESIGF